MICETNDIFTDEYQKGDCCYAVITGRNGKGSYLELDNGQKAYAYGIGNLRNNTKIICSITRSAIDGKYALARLDSICSLYNICA